MAKSEKSKNGQRKNWLSRIGSLVSFAMLVAAVVKEFKTPSEERTGHGVVAGVVPYDFRMPTIDRMKERWWNPEGKLFGPQVFGVGWTLNMGAALQRAKELFGT